MFNQCYLQSKSVDGSYSIQHIASTLSFLRDSVGFNGVYWVLIVMLCLLLMIHVIFELSKHITKSASEKQTEVSVNDDNNSTIQLTSTLSLVSSFHQLRIYP